MKQKIKHNSNIQTDKRNVSNDFPEAIVLIGFRDIFGDNPKDNYKTLLKDVPLIVALTEVLKSQLSIHFTMYDVERHRQLLDTLYPTLEKPQRRALSQFCKRNAPNVTFFNTDATLHFCFEAIRYCCDMEEDDNQLTPYREERLNIIKAYSRCSQEFVESQKIDDNIRDTLLLLDLCGSEFKFHKDFKPAVYKATRFFEFCESQPAYLSYLKAFCEDYGVEHWREYLSRLVQLFCDSIKKIAVRIDQADKESLTFLDRFTIDREEIRAIPSWEDKAALLYLRDHFLVKFSYNVYYIISPDLIADKIYQGLKFMFFKSICKHGLMRPDGKKPFGGQPDFNKQLGEDFSETRLAYSLFEDSLKNKVDQFITGAELKAGGMKDGEPDLYIRQGDNLMLVEVKDLILGDDIKKSNDIEAVREGILKRICHYPEKPHKGFGQILDNIERLNQGAFLSFDSESENVKSIYPVIITTDNAFSSIGLNSLITERAAEIMAEVGSRFGKRFIALPIILDIDTLINLSYRLHTGETDIFKLFWKYITECRSKLIPFKAFVWEHYIRGRHLDIKETQFLFGKSFQKS